MKKRGDLELFKFSGKHFFVNHSLFRKIVLQPFLVENVETGGCIITRPHNKIRRVCQNREVGARGELDCESRQLTTQRRGNPANNRRGLVRLLHACSEKPQTHQTPPTSRRFGVGHARSVFTFEISINLLASTVYVRLQVTKNPRAGSDDGCLATRVQALSAGSAYLYRPAVELRTRPLLEAGVDTHVALRGDTSNIISNT